MSGFVVPPSLLAAADQEFASFTDAVAGMTETAREMLTDSPPMTVASMIAFTLAKRIEADPGEARKTAYILGAALVRLAECEPEGRPS